MTGRMFAVAVLLCAAVPLQAQPRPQPQPLMSAGAIDLHAEMWAMAGVCSQFTRYNVRESALADHLNAAMSRLGAEQQDALVNGRSARLQAIAARSAQLTAMSAGPRRDDAATANTEELMTRCQALVRDHVAGEYFLTRRN